MGPKFFETRMGQRFYESTMPRIASALERIADSLEKHVAGSTGGKEAGPAAASDPSGGHKGEGN